MFYTDQPIRSKQADLLGRAPFARRLARSIAEFRREESYAVALQGRWGCGKTSTLNLALDELKDIAPKMIVVRFHPWSFTDASQLISQFFVALTHALQLPDPDKRLAQAGAAIERYAGTLEYAEYIPVIGPYLKLLPKLAGQLGGGLKERAQERTDDAAYQKRRVEDALRDCGRRILIVIDDIDRLPNEQIRLIFQLVNAVAGFPNTTYLLAYDRQIVTRALGAVHNCDGAAYLEKIVQVAFDLPPLREDRLRDILLARLAEAYPLPEGRPFDPARWQRVLEACIAPFLRSLRDVNRFSNAFAFAYAAVRDEVDFIDMAGVCALQTFAPPVFHWIHDNRHTLTGGYAGGVPLNTIEEHRKQATESLQAVWPDDPAGALRAVSSLFPAFANATSYSTDFQTPQQLHQAMRVAAEGRFELYFSLSPEDVKISRAELDESLLHMDAAQWQAYLDTLDARRLLPAYLGELCYHTSRVPAGRAALAISVLLSRAEALCRAAEDWAAPLSAQPLSAQLLPALLLRLDSDAQRLAVLDEQLRTASLPAFRVLSELLQRIEFAHGRGHGRGDEALQLVPAGQLPQLEALFLARLRQLTQDAPLAGWPNAGRYLLLWKLADPADFSAAMQRTFNEDALSAAGYLAQCVEVWSDGGWHLPSTYSRRSVSVFDDLPWFHTEDALAVIDRARQMPAFWQTDALPERAAAYVLLADCENPLTQLAAGKIRARVAAWHEALPAPA